ncbi:MAG: hypothetical protein ACOH18_05340 [Candidatus Saccharimonadaceae bacterium]
MALRITQTGVALTVGIIVVTGLMIGGFFIVKNSGEQARREDAIKIAEQSLNDQSNNGVALNNDSNKTSNESTTSPDEATTNDGTTTESADSSSHAETSNQTATQLPQTGPVNQLVNLMVIALLTFSIVTYVTSYRQSSSI